MKAKIKLLGITFLIVFMYSCNKDKVEKTDFKAIDSIPTNKYYSSDIMPDIYKNIYGNWKVIGSSGGFAGRGYKIDFDFLVFKANGIFGIIRNDSLIAFGNMILSSNEHSLLCKFDFDKSAKIQLYYDSEKYIQFINNDTLNLNAPCCDRYNIHFIRDK